MMKEFIVRVILFIQWIFYFIMNKLIKYDECIIYVEKEKGKQIENKSITFLFNIVNVFRFTFYKNSDEVWLVRVNKNGRYCVKEYVDKYFIKDMISDIELLDCERKNHKIMTMKINNKEINIRRYDGYCNISEIIKLEFGRYCDEDVIEFMDEDFDDFKYTACNIKDKKLCDF